MAERGEGMMSPIKLQCMTTSSWLRGYASTLDEYKHSALIHKLNQAADLLADVWNEYAEANGFSEIKVPESGENK